MFTDESSCKIVAKMEPQPSGEPACARDQLCLFVWSAADCKPGAPGIAKLGG